VTGKDILEKAGLVPAEDYELLKKVNERGFEPIQLDEVVDLKEPGIEGFSAKRYKVISICIDDVTIEVDECFMTPNDILILAGLDPTEFYLTEIRKGNIEVGYKEDRLHRIAITKNSKFCSYSLIDEVCIIVNGTVFNWEKRMISYVEVLQLAGVAVSNHETQNASVIYSRGVGGATGSLAIGQKVNVKNKMEFDVTPTNKS
jgi:hypothetical protein